MKIFDKFIDPANAVNTHSGTVETFATALEKKYSPDNPTRLDIINKLEKIFEPLTNPTNANE